MDRVGTAGRMSWVFLVLGIAITFLQLWMLPSTGFWTPDDGNKYLIGRAADSSLLRPTLPYLGREMDPELRWAPIRTPFAHVVDDRLVSQYPPAFSLLSRVVEGGRAGKAHLLVPVWAGFFLLLAVGRFAPSFDAPRSLSLLLAWPLSPLLFYGTLHWEHTLVAALVTVALGTLVRAAHRENPENRGVGLAGISLAVATGLREETILIVLATGIVLLRQNRSLLLRSALVYGATLLPFVLWQWFGTGSLIGIHFRGNVDFSQTSPAQWILERGEVARALLFSTLPLRSLVAVVLAGVLVLVGGLGLARSARPAREAVSSNRGSLTRSGFLALTCIGLLLLSLSTYRMLHDSLQPMVLIRCSGLFLFAPWIVFGLVPVATRSLRTLRSILAVSLLLFLVATPTISASGVHWGPRILLSLLPAAAWLAAAGFAWQWRQAVGWGLPWNARRRTILGICAALSFLAILSFQLAGLSLQRRSVEANAAMREQTRAAIDMSTTLPSSESPAGAIPIVTHLWWYAQLFAPLSLERPIYQVTSEDDFAAWFAAFSAAGHTRFFLATAAPDYEILRGLPLRVRPVAEIADPRQPTLRHRLLEVQRAPVPTRTTGRRFFSPWDR